MLVWLFFFSISEYCRWLIKLGVKGHKNAWSARVPEITLFVMWTSFNALRFWGHHWDCTLCGMGPSWPLVLGLQNRILWFTDTVMVLLLGIIQLHDSENNEVQWTVTESATTSTHLGGDFTGKKNDHGCFKWDRFYFHASYSWEMYFI